MTISMMLTGAMLLCLGCTNLNATTFRRAKTLPIYGIAPTKGKPELVKALARFISDVMTLQNYIQNETRFLEESYLTEGGRGKISNLLGTINKIIQDLNSMIKNRTIDESLSVDTAFTVERNKIEGLMGQIRIVSEEDYRTYRELKEMIRFNADEVRRVESQIKDLERRKSQTKEPLVIEHLTQNIEKSNQRKDRLLQQIIEEKEALNKRATLAAEYLTMKKPDSTQRKMINLIISLGGIKEGKEDAIREKIKMQLIEPLRAIKDEFARAQTEQISTDKQIDLFTEQLRASAKNGETEQVRIISDKIDSLRDQRRKLEKKVLDEKKAFDMLTRRVLDSEYFNPMDLKLITEIVRKQDEETESKANEGAGMKEKSIAGFDPISKTKEARGIEANATAVTDSTPNESEAETTTTNRPGSTTTRNESEAETTTNANTSERETTATATVRKTNAAKGNS